MTLADRLQEILHGKVDLVSPRGVKPSLLQVIEKGSFDI
jgi:predicted nucleotidyltransferase